MNVVDAIILLLILSFGALGAKRGFFKQTLMTVGTVFIFILAFALKDPVANIISLKLPFWDFKGIASGLTSLNILFYQLIAFLIVLIVLFIVLEILIKIASGIEKLLKWTIVLGIPSKILGFLVGILEGYVIMFIVLFVLSLPFINIKLVNDAKLKPIILNSSPVLTNVVEKTNEAVVDIYKEIDKYDGKDKTKLNLSIIKLLLKYDIIDKEYLKSLQDAGKFNIAGLDALT